MSLSTTAHPRAFRRVISNIVKTCEHLSLASKVRITHNFFVPLCVSFSQSACAVVVGLRRTPLLLADGVNTRAGDF